MHSARLWQPKDSARDALPTYNKMVPKYGKKSAVSPHQSLAVPQALLDKLGHTRQAKAKSHWHASAEHEQNVDTVQFSAMWFYTKEEGGCVQVDIIRFGDCTDRCSATFSTENGDATAGERYIAATGRVTFERGVQHQCIEIKIIPDDNFNCSSHFRVHLDEPENCFLDDLSTCYVMIVDDDSFPRNKLRVDGSFSADIAALWAFVQFVLTTLPGMKGKAFINACLDQLWNANYLLMVYVQVYLVDVVLNLSDTGDLLLVPGSRAMTASVLALFWVVPGAILAAVTRIQMGPLSTKGKVVRYLRVKLLTKYSHYTDHSRRAVPQQVLFLALIDEIPELCSHCYDMAFDLLRCCGKCVCVLFFMISRHPHNAIPLIIYPIVIFSRLAWRRQTFKNLAEKEKNAFRDMLGMVYWFVTHLMTMISLHLPPDAILQFVDAQLDCASKEKALSIYSFWGQFWTPMLTNLLLFSVVLHGSNQVLEGTYTVGGLLGTLECLAECGRLFVRFEDNLNTMISSIDPLMQITELLNAQTATQAHMELHETRHGHSRSIFPKKHHSEEREGKCLSEAVDSLPIIFDNVKFCWGRPGFSAQVAPGQVIGVLGGECSGKARLCNMIGGLVTPSSGTLILPVHMKALVAHPHQAHFIETISLQDNLTLGASSHLYISTDRVRAICNRLDLCRDWTVKQFQEILDSHGLPWHVKLSASEVSKVILARAFVLNPELLVVHDPMGGKSPDTTSLIMKLLREFSDNRGLELRASAMSRRRPRTVFFSANIYKEELVSPSCDTIWHLPEKVRPAGVTKGASGSSWGRLVQEAAQARQLTMHKGLHHATASVPLAVDDRIDFKEVFNNMAPDSVYINGVLQKC